MKKTSLKAPLLAAAMLLSMAAYTQSARAQSIDTPYQPASQKDAGLLGREYQAVIDDRSTLARDRSVHPSRVSADEARLKADMAGYHRDSDNTADNMNGQQVMTTYTSKTFYPLP